MQITLNLLGGRLRLKDMKPIKIKENIIADHYRVFLVAEMTTRARND